MTIAPLLIIFLGFCGFTLAFYISGKKRDHKTLVCPMKASCDFVVKSKHSKFFGLPVEYLGMAYYSLIAIGYAVPLAAPEVVTPLYSFTLVLATTFAVLFSIYLTALQAFVIKHWCTWCLCSAAICAVIFGLTVTNPALNVVRVLSFFAEHIWMAHLLVFGLGLGAATISDLFLVKFLKDFRLSDEEHDVLHSLAQITWACAGGVLLTALMLWIPEVNRVALPHTFLVSLTVLAVVILNLSFMHTLVTPVLKITQGRRHAHEPGELVRSRRMAYGFASVSLISWYFAFLMTVATFDQFGMGALLGFYAFILFVGMLLSQMLARFEFS